MLYLVEQPPHCDPLRLILRLEGFVRIKTGVFPDKYFNHPRGQVVRGKREERRGEREVKLGRKKKSNRLVFEYKKLEIISKFKKGKIGEISWRNC